MQEKDHILKLKSYQSFLADMNNNRLFHSIMLINADHEFLRVYASLLAGEILAEGAEDKERTKLKVDKEIHPDLFVFGKEKAIDAAAAKEIVGSVYVSPYEGSRKVYILDRFDEIQAAPANKLLKTLEEPPAGVTFILLVRNDSRVLQTLLSRSQKFYLEGFGQADVANILKARGINDGEVISLEAGGNLTDAIKLAENKNATQIAQFVLNTFENFRLTTQLSKYLKQAEEFKDTLPELLAFFANVASLALHRRAGLEISCSGDILIAINRVARIWNDRGLVGVIEASINAHKMIEGFVGQANVLDQFFLKILEVRRKCNI